MAPTVRTRVLRALRAGELTATSPLSDVPYLGPYLVDRLARAFRMGTPPTIEDLWGALHRRTGEDAARRLHRALQNRTCNQCVATRTRSGGGRREYHTGDVNERGYEACAALLEHAASVRGARHGRLPRTLGRRSAASKVCGCRATGECESDRRCALSSDGACVPRGASRSGFQSAAPRPPQAVRASEVAARRRAGRVRRPDADAAADLAAGHARAPTYASPRAGTAWRRPGPLARMPLLVG